MGRQALGRSAMADEGGGWRRITNLGHHPSLRHPIADSGTTHSTPSLCRRPHAASWISLRRVLQPAYGSDLLLSLAWGDFPRSICGSLLGSTPDDQRRDRERIRCRCMRSTIPCLRPQTSDTWSGGLSPPRPPTDGKISFRGQSMQVE